MDRRNKGLTLIEVLVVVTILSILAVTLYTVFRSGVDAWSKSEARLEIYQNARAILDQISRELQGAFVGDGATFTGIDGTVSPTGKDTLVFITNFGASIYKFYYWLDTSNNVLVREYIDIDDPADYTSSTYDGEVEFGSDRAMISNIDFFYADGGSWSADGTWFVINVLPKAVKVELELQNAEGHTYSFETTIYLPNSK